MRLIDVNTLELKVFFGSQTPRYAILSHTWDGDKEVTFQEWERRTDSTVRRKDGYAKIVGACRRAQADGLQYLWCDTNCIDKTSSAELSEAINSMFAWYRDSYVCYAYLADVQAKTGTFAKSRWFTRGWTLQELLAPNRVTFFDHRWTVLGDRSELAGVISDISRIHIGALKDRETIDDYSIAQRMSWAADRETSRKEDIAYCLLGVFDINMPLLYGEGSNAFTRLQKEIIKLSDDQSILAWEFRDIDAHPWTTALAPSPAEFRFCGSIIRDWEIERNPYSITNLGISMKVPVIKTVDIQVIMVGLNCAKELRGTETLANPSRQPHIQVSRRFQIWIPLSRLDEAIYIRGHRPLSRIFLGRSYPLLTRPKSTNLFLTINKSKSKLRTSYLSTVPVDFLKNRTLVPSGVLVTIASGEMRPDAPILKKVYPLENISIISLKDRDKMTLSHQLISSGNLSIVISVYWDENYYPQRWMHTIIIDPRLEVTRQMASERDWRCLFGTCTHVDSPVCNTPDGLCSIHERLQKMHIKAMGVFKMEESYPLVWINKQPLRDLHGSSELVVDIVFREQPRSV
ncbi:HET-domain-containing protein [Annulohypoxylon bovei var. microspora]|nr:HET-domain-containing protein [Annulohypoxylon bovei var. microspora]